MGCTPIVQYKLRRRHLQCVGRANTVCYLYLGSFRRRRGTYGNIATTDYFFELQHVVAEASRTEKQARLTTHQKERRVTGAS
mmetsp:Transcript_1230/g.3286  ORF Transcript_1230/g.3286 Transcript_1230/m.3286 type:complete len:82 (+) Transcript_1230:1813-2058(+)